MIEFTGLLRSIGKQVEQTGDQRESILRKLEGITGKSLEDDHLEIADAFLAGLRN